MTTTPLHAHIKKKNRAAGNPPDSNKVGDERSEKQTIKCLDSKHVRREQESLDQCQ